MSKTEWSGTQKKILSAVLLAVFLAFWGLIAYYIGKPMLDFIEEPESFRLWVGSHSWTGRLIYVGMVILQVLVAIIPGEPLELGAGYAFGFWEGTLLCVAGITIGSVLVFWLVRRLGVKFVRIFFPDKKLEEMKFLQNTKRLNTVVFIIFLIPGTPKDILSYVVGLTPMRLRTWLLISSVARLPSIITSTLGGNALGTARYPLAVWVLVISLVISAAGLLVYNRFSRETAADTPPQGTAGGSEQTEGPHHV